MRQNANWTWRKYLIQRTARLWIVLIPALVIGGLLDCAGRFWLHSPVYLGTQGNHSIQGDVAQWLEPQVLLGNLAFLQGTYSHTFGSNGPLWSLANEFWYYIWFPAVYFALKRRSLQSGVVLFAAAP